MQISILDACCVTTQSILPSEIMLSLATAAIAFAPSPVARPQMARTAVRAQMSFFDVFQQAENQDILNQYWATTFAGLTATGLLAVRSLDLTTLDLTLPC